MHRWTAEFSRLATPKFAWIARHVPKATTFSILDVGVANRSPSRTKLLFPLCRYSAIDLVPMTSYPQDDQAAIDAFFQMDISRLEFETIPDEAYDVVILAHVIEHVPNGEDVVVALAPKLRVGGLMYIEFPSPRSLKLPSLPNTLNFYDDPGHVRLYSTASLVLCLQKAGFATVAFGTRRSALRLAATPIAVVRDLIKHGRPQGPAFWDLLGFADYIAAVKEPKD